MRSEQELKIVLNKIAVILDENKITPEECNVLLESLKEINDKQGK